MALGMTARSWIKSGFQSFTGTKTTWAAVLNASALCSALSPAYWMVRVKVVVAVLVAEVESCPVRVIV